MTTSVNTEVALEEKENASLAVADVVVPATARATTEVEVATKSTASRVPRTGATAHLADSAKRFVSSFRGRTVHGVKVAVPNGYLDIALRGDAHGKARQTTGSNHKHQLTRLRQLRRKSDVIEEVQYQDDAAKMSPEGWAPRQSPETGAQVRFVRPVPPDIAVDEGKDESLRSLSEWVNRFTKASVFHPRCMSTMGSIVYHDPVIINSLYMHPSFLFVCVP